MEELMCVTQLPVIEEHLKSLKGEIEDVVKEATSLVCTEGTIQIIKLKRAELRKTYEVLETERKAIKTAILQPYAEFEAIYQDCVSAPFKSADKALKSRIDAVETEIKQNCIDGLKDYFSELCHLHQLPWLTYKQSGVKVSLSSAKAKTPKKIREELEEFVSRVGCDCDRISQMNNAAEIMEEYKKSLDASAAIFAVEERHRRVDAELAELDSRAKEKAAEAETVRKVEAVAPPVGIPSPQAKDEQILHCIFSAWGTRGQLLKVKNFLIAEGIKYE